MRFLADESCDFTFVRVLRSAGHDVLAVAESAAGAPDDKIIALAHSQLSIVDPGAQCGAEGLLGHGASLL